LQQQTCNLTLLSLADNFGKGKHNYCREEKVYPNVLNRLRPLQFKWLESRPIKQEAAETILEYVSRQLLVRSIS
jgi:hypothetical protein